MANPPCPNCEKPLKKFTVKKEDSPRKGESFYKCDPCTEQGTKIFIWECEYGKEPAKKAGGFGKRKADGPPPAAQEDDEAQRWRLRIETKLDEILKTLKEAQEAMEQ